MERVTTAAEVLGALCLTVAAWSVAWPLGLALAGLCLIAGAVFASLGAQR